MSFTWVPFYEELADKVAAYEKRQKELADLIADVLREAEMPVDWLRDKDASGRRGPLDAIDPFTFFAAINRGITNENRAAILQALKRRMQISAAVPNGFDGIPVVDNRNAWFFDYKAVRKSGAIGDLWALFLECRAKTAADVKPDIFEKGVEAVGLGKITMGLFWVRPSEYIALDGVMRRFLKGRLPAGAIDSANALQGYAALVRAVREAFPGRSFCDLSHEAWTAKQKDDQEPPPGTERQPESRMSKPAYWVMALGEHSEFWDDCHSKGVVRVGWDELNRDLAGLTAQGLEAEYRRILHNTDDLKGIRDFVLMMRPGDRVFIKQGRTKIIAFGEVAAGSPATAGKDYLFNPNLDTYRHLRPVKWLKIGVWELDKEMRQLPVKTLTPADEKRVGELLSLIGWDETDDRRKRIDLPGLNVIFYGPPGTGKTYHLRQLFGQFTERRTQSREGFAGELVADLSWWETIAATLYDLNRPKASVSEILAHPLLVARVRQAGNRHPRAAVWSSLQIHTKEDCELVKYSQRSLPLLFTKDTESLWSVDRQIVEEERPDLLEVTRKYRDFKPVETDIRRYRFVTFHQSFSYEDFVEGIKPVLRTANAAEKGGDETQQDVGYALVRGVFRELAEEARRDPGHNYALFIDEINRGNVANIFGELITFIEEDKRLNPDGDLRASPWTAILPYSREPFGVPKNLYVVGTMNTADRSIEAIDTALRRRFSFVPVYPDARLLAEYQPAGFDVNLERLLKAINERLEAILDRDHAIGHSHLMKVKDGADPLGALRRIFADHIIPQLQEYFYGNPARVGMVLGPAFVVKRSTGAELMNVDGESDDLDPKEVCDITPSDTWDVAAFQSIYA